MRYFQSTLGLKIAPDDSYDAQARRGSLSPLSPADRPGPQPQQNRETRTMRIISEKAIALLLAVALSGTAFQTFIV
ncbi:hypothetical protein ACLBKU_04825 [Erythrobacter sp. NE805]|uniref:hypothetical protein n=1 Tax=Erythrobacter sp. NE805 TaxID=3389875 RepID=UPI00396AF680